MGPCSSSSKGKQANPILNKNTNEMPSQINIDNPKPIQPIIQNSKNNQKGYAQENSPQNEGEVAEERSPNKNDKGSEMEDDEPRTVPNKKKNKQNLFE